MKNKKKGTSKKNWVVDCRTDSAFDFALKVLKEAKNIKYPYDLRVNFVKIAYSNSCEAIAKAQTDPQEFKLSSAFKLFIRNLKEISIVCTILKSSMPANFKYTPLFKNSIIENPFDYIDINYDIIEKYFKTAKVNNKVNNLKMTVDSNITVLFSTRYNYPRIYEDCMSINETEFARLLPTNDIIIYLNGDLYDILKMPLDLSSYYPNNTNKIKNSAFINLIEGRCLATPNSQIINTPYESFRNISGLISAAAKHPENVNEICVTAYRLGDDSSIINDIILATKNGIYCKLYLEISARGEIGRDLIYIEKLINEADQYYLDIKFRYSGIKVHGKMIYIGLKYAKEHEPEAIGVFSTGNYNDETSKIYKDYHYISCDEAVIEMIRRNFSIIWNSEQPVLSSMSNILSKEIYQEIAKGKNGRIWMQTNHLDNKHIVDLLKEAIRRGCDVKLIVRTTRGFHNKELKNCKTIVGKYLEHSRVYIFGSRTTSDRRVYLSSSDILFRNLYNRFESYVKIKEPDIGDDLERDFQDLYKNGQK